VLLEGFGQVACGLHKCLIEIGLESELVRQCWACSWHALRIISPNHRVDRHHGVAPGKKKATT
jgi:hypothetical protein